MSVAAEYLRFRGVPFQVVFHRRSETSVDEASALGVPADAVLKTVVIDTRGGRALAVIPASRRLDLRLVRGALEDHHARLASEHELSRDFRVYELGAMPPLGSLIGCRTLVDPEVFLHDSVLFAAGSQTESIKADPKEVFRIEPVTVIGLTDEFDREEDKEYIA